MATEASVAIIVASMALIGSVVTIYTSASKNDVEVLRGIIQELKIYVEELEEDKIDLQTWAEKLVCQIKDGPSPRVWGIQADQPVSPYAARSITTRVGNTLTVAS